VLPQLKMLPSGSARSAGFPAARGEAAGLCLTSDYPSERVGPQRLPL
jgi:hypothetical protein